MLMKGTEIIEVKVEALFEKTAGLIEESRKMVSSGRLSAAAIEAARPERNERSAYAPGGCQRN